LPCQCSRSAPQEPASDSPRAVWAVQWPSHPCLFFSARQVPCITICPALTSVQVPSAASGCWGRALPVQVPWRVWPLPAVAIQVPWMAWAGSCANALQRTRMAISRTATENNVRMIHLREAFIGAARALPRHVIIARVFGSLCAAEASGLPAHLAVSPTSSLVLPGTTEILPRISVPARILRLSRHRLHHRFLELRQRCHDCFFHSVFGRYNMGNGSGKRHS
jgi:hypothetical protein